MGFAVLHLEKARGTDSAMSAHIERKITPKNADPSRAHLNLELVQFPEGVTCRTQAIQHRLDHAGLKRKIGTNQVRAIRVLLSGSREDMQRIEQTGQLDRWCADTLAWLRKTYGAENIVSAVLHMDETTPHIHATMVPIVTGERRKAQTQQTPEPGKKSYRKKNPDTARLCADDVMARPKLKTYQNTYAASMQHFGLQRGIEGSEAKHISGSRFYRELFLRQDEIKNQVRASIRHRNDVNSQINDLYENRDEAREKFYAMDKFVQGKQTEAQQLQQQIDHARQQLQTDDPVAVLLRLEREIDELRQQLADKQNDLDILHAIFPPARQWLGWAKLLQKMGFAVKQIVELFTFRPIKFTGKLYSPEFKCNFETADSTAQLKCETNDQQLLLHIDNHEFRNWFKQKQITIQRDNQDEQENRPRKGMEMR